MSRKNTKTNPMLITLILELKKQAQQQDAPIWKDIAVRLEKPLQNWPKVNLNKINNYLQKDETALIPGKVLSTGTIMKKASIAAWSFSEKAEQKIKNAGGTCLSIEEVLKKNPKGKNIRIMG